jgi:hypothetical protein
MPMFSTVWMVRDQGQVNKDIPVFISPLFLADVEKEWQI